MKFLTIDFDGKSIIEKEHEVHLPRHLELKLARFILHTASFRMDPTQFSDAEWSEIVK